MALSASPQARSQSAIAFRFGPFRIGHVDRGNTGSNVVYHKMLPVIARIPWKKKVKGNVVYFKFPDAGRGCEQALESWTAWRSPTRKRPRCPACRPPPGRSYSPNLNWPDAFSTRSFKSGFNSTACCRSCFASVVFPIWAWASPRLK